MKTKYLSQITLLLASAVLMTATRAAGAVITYNTSAAGTEFTNNDTLTLSNTSGAAATLTFIVDPNTVGGAPPPDNINLGNFTLVCATCSTQAANTSSTTFGAFTFDLVITDVTDGGATGTFVGTSTGGKVYSDASGIVITWEPLQVGPGTNNATSGNFGSTVFTIGGTLDVVAPDSGQVPGQTTVQGTLDAAPEPATLSLIGGSLLGLGLFRRKMLTALRSKNSIELEH
jgi:hypothetical protein